MKKKIVGMILGAGAAYLGVKKYQSLKENRSLRSKLLEEAADKVSILPDASSERNFRIALKKSAKEYRLPSYIRNFYGFQYANGYDDTLEVMPEGNLPSQTIFYLHGGAYWMGPMLPHYATIKKMADHTNSRVLMPIYPKAPSYTVDDVFSFVSESYRRLLEENKKQSMPIIFMGDSAGGGLALAFAQQLKRENNYLPSKLILLSPWLDVSNSNPKMAELQSVDTLLEQKSLAFQGEIYAGEHSVKASNVSPIYGEFEGLPPIFMITGSHDILSVDVLKLQEMAEEYEWDIQTFYFEKMMHTFMLLPSPEGKEALELIYQLVVSTEFE